MSKGTPYSKILGIIGVENTPVNRGTLSDIKRGKAYNTAVNKYYKYS